MRNLNASRVVQMAQAWSRLLFAVVVAILVAHIGLALAAPHFAPQMPGCA